MKFREITLETGTKLTLGKDEESNDELMKEFEGKPNKIIHTVASGSPFCVIKSPLNPSEAEIFVSGGWCARYSQDWRDNQDDVRVNVFTGKDIKKEDNMKPGTWEVKKAEIITINKESIKNIEATEK